MFFEINPMVLTFVILALTIIAFIVDKVRMDIVASCSLLSLYLTGLVTTNQMLSGFANSTVITIAGLFVVGAGLFHTGVADWLGRQLLRLAGASEFRLTVALMVGTAFLSAFMSNTGTVAVLLPAVVAAAWGIGSSPSKLLIPLAFAANIGGLLTLIGTPPNIVMSNALRDANLRPFGFFEFSLIGLPLLLVGIIYTVIVGRFMLPDRKANSPQTEAVTSPMELAANYLTSSNLIRLRVRTASPLVGKTLANTRLGQTYGLNVLNISRPAPDNGNDEASRNRLVAWFHRLSPQTSNTVTPLAETVIQADDVLLVEGEADAAYRAALKLNLGVQPSSEGEDGLSEEYFSKEVGLAEVLITPRSSLIGQSVVESHFAEKYNVRVLGIRRRGETLTTTLSGTKLTFGDALLVHGAWQDIHIIQRESRNFVVVGQPVRAVTEDTLSPKAITSLVVMSGMLLMMLLGLAPTVVAVLITALLMVVTGCLTMEEAYQAINWESIILIASMLPLSTALQETGGAEFIANTLVSTLGGNSMLLLGGLFLLTTAFTQVISNTATSVLLAPIAIGAAQDLGLSPHMVMMMVAVGTSTAFITPIASPVNMLVLNPGNYRFSDFVKLGLPLAAIFLVLATVWVPLIWGVSGG